MMKDWPALPICRHKISNNRRSAPNVIAEALLGWLFGNNDDDDAPPPAREPGH